MMFGLGLNVGNGVILLRNPKCECAVAFLPRKTLCMRFVHPSGRSAFHQLHGFCNGHGRGQGQENVDVIFRATDHERFESIFASDPAKECPEFRLELGRNEIAAKFRGKYAVHQVGDVGVRHVGFDCGDSRGYAVKYGGARIK